MTTSNSARLNPTTVTIGAAQQAGHSAMTETTHGKLIVVSGPSGAGKTTLLKRMFNECAVPLIGSISATTRAPRRGEVDGVDYHFLSQAEFDRRREAGEFLECFEVFGRGDWYGTLCDEVAPRLAVGKWVVLEIDVQGTLAVLQHYPHAVTIFIEPVSIDEPERRLRLRGTETEDAIQRRLDTARRELAQAHLYRHRVTNDDLDRAVAELCNVLKQNDGGDS